MSLASPQDSPRAGSSSSAHTSPFLALQPVCLTTMDEETEARRGDITCPSELSLGRPGDSVGSQGRIQVELGCLWVTCSHEPASCSTHGHSRGPGTLSTHGLGWPGVTAPFFPGAGTKGQSFWKASPNSGGCWGCAPLTNARQEDTGIPNQMSPAPEAMRLVPSWLSWGSPGVCAFGPQPLAVPGRGCVCGGESRGVLGRTMVRSA